MRYLVVFLVLVFLSCSVQFEGESSRSSDSLGLTDCVCLIPHLYQGNITTVDEWRWVDVMNLETVQSGNNAFTFGNRCDITEGGILRVIAPTNLTGCCSVLVRYEAPRPAYGTGCPTGIIFFIDNVDFKEMDKNSAGILAKRQSERDYIKFLLEQEER